MKAPFHFGPRSSGAFSMVIFGKVSIPVSTIKFHSWSSICAPNPEFHPWPPVSSRPWDLNLVLLGSCFNSLVKFYYVHSSAKISRDLTAQKTFRSTVKGSAEVGTWGLTRIQSKLRFHSTYDTCPQGDSSGILPAFYPPHILVFRIDETHWTLLGGSDLMA